MSKIKIGFVINNLAVGGISRLVVRICNGLEPEKYEVHLFILSIELEMKNELPLNSHVNLYTYDYQYENNYSLISYLQNALVLSKTKERAKEFLNDIFKIDIQMLHFFTHPRELSIGILAKKSNSNLNLVFTDQVMRIGKNDYNWFQRGILAFSYRLLYQNYHLVASSEAVRKYIINFNLNNSKKLLETLDNSIEIDQYNRRVEVSALKKNQFIYIARMNHHKGQDTLIKAWRKLDNLQKGSLYLVGPDESNGKIKDLAKGDDSIFFTGGISDMEGVLNNSTFGVFPSQKEGLPLAMLEMMAYNLPIIVSDIPELTNIVRHEKEGLHFRLDDIDDLRDKLNYLINEKSKALEFGINAKKRVEAICKLNEPISFYNNFYHQILVSRRN